MPLPPENIRPTPPQYLTKPPFSILKHLTSSFQTTSHRNPPPSPQKTKHIRFISIGPSHYCEKVRWALDLLLESSPTNPIYYTEDAHPPVFHTFETLPASNNRASQVPMIVFDDGECVFDSTTILKRLCPFLYPSSSSDNKQQQSVESFENELDERLGSSVRCIVYHEYLQPHHSSNIKKLLTSNTSIIESILFSRFLTPISMGMKKAMNINEDTASASYDAIRSIYKDVSDRLLQTDSSYILGNQFTAADLTFAALSGPVLLPPELHLINVVDLEEIPTKLKNLRKELIDTPAGQHVLKMYRHHRIGGGSSFNNNKEQTKQQRVVMIKSLGRNRVPAWMGVTFVGVGALSLVVGAGMMMRQQRSRL